MIHAGERRRWAIALGACAIALAAACASNSSKAGTPLPTSVTGSVPAPTSHDVHVPDHIVVVIFENKGVERIVGARQAPTFNSMAAQGAFYTRSYAVTHPSQPNYVALFSGGAQGVTDDSCPHTFQTGNIARQLLDAGLTFTGYAEALPYSGFTGCGEGNYARKHAPWTDFANVPARASQPFSAFPTDFTKLPSVAFVVPDLCNDMHDCSVSTGDRWLAKNMGAYATWAKAHHSVLVVTFDEDDSSGANLITTFAVGQQVAPATISRQVDHYTLLRTIETCFGLPPLGVAALRAPMSEICN